MIRTKLASLQRARRRLSWLPSSLSVSSIFALTANLAAYVFSLKRAGKTPTLIKIDISPVCALACPTCLHADALGRDRPLLTAQKFDSSQRMGLDKFRQLVGQMRGQSIAVSLQYYGDPLAHPDFVRFVEVASAAGLGVHATTHFSYSLSDSRLKQIVESGLTHLTVAVDGATQAVYEVTRVRGRLDFVLSNLRRLIVIRNGLGRTHPQVEVQHIIHPHHGMDERGKVEAICTDFGIDTFIAFPGIRYDKNGDLFNVVDNDIGVCAPGPAKPKTFLPKCHWPYTSAVVRYDGDVIPCCMWREARQYTGGRDPLALGNVFDTPLDEIWNGPEYRKIRRKVSDPGADDEPSFCTGCYHLYDTPELVDDWRPQ